ncbi:GntR family transcriptional regulator [Olivibacter sitiensis]|uniref:GntR family transcriptional regulator n=1 Tax=Olivibacter sitiensis TaxID=376470 RepID=UPI0003F5CA88|nr:GntR family transcriptional regulator [Olivibacter sitiensis]
MEFRNNEAIYVQIANYMSEQILLGKWEINEKIPSVRETATELEVNPNTVMRSYEQLQQADIIFNKRGIGFFVSPNSHQLIKKQQREQFMQEELPIFFRKIYLLGIPLEEIREKYNSYITATYKNK